ncbi:MAG: hypothetical protein WC470_00955 [Candidatus Paceibacterota bacterium]
MNFEIIAGVILAVSFLSIVFMALKKTSDLKNLPHKENIIPVGKLKENIRHKTVTYWNHKVPDFYHFLQNFILKTRELFTKADNKMLELLLKLKNRTDKGRVELDDYWKDIRTNLKKNSQKNKSIEVSEKKEETEQVNISEKVHIRKK